MGARRTHGFEPNESPAAALAREIHEELGLHIQVGPLLARGSAPASNNRVIALDGYAAHILTGTVVLREHAQNRWECGASNQKRCRLWRGTKVVFAADVNAPLFVLRHFPGTYCSEDFRGRAERAGIRGVVFSTELEVC